MRKTVVCILALPVFIFVSCGKPDTKNGENGTIVDSEEMITVPAGKFWMGCNESVDDECQDNEKPYHEVYLSAYKIDKYEVTVEKYQECIDSGDCNNDNSNERHYNKYAEDDPYSQDIPNCNLGVTDKSKHPMNCVSWYGAKAYCEWKGLRLPTEAEWEKAARGTDGRKYPWGNEPEVSCEYAVIGPYNDKIDDYDFGCGANSTWIVGSKKKGESPYGAYDMIGNVFEWVNDWYGESYYAVSSAENPSGPETGDARVLRGGSWAGNYGNPNRASFRLKASPAFFWGRYSGFRCAVGIEEDSSDTDDEDIDDNGDSDVPCSGNFSEQNKGICWSDKAPYLMNHNDAVRYCQNLGGRLPTISELRALVQNCPQTEYPKPDGLEENDWCEATDDCLSLDECINDVCEGCSYDYSGRYSVFLDEGIFWSSSFPEDDVNAWGLHFNYATVGYENKTKEYNIRCVR